MKHLPPWKTPSVPSTKASDETPDVLIVGAGIAGLTAGYLLAKEGRRVCILDAAEPAGGESRMTSAHVSNALDDRYRHLARIHGAEGARLAAQSHTEAIAMIERIVAAEGIDCDFRRVDGYLFLPPEGDEKSLDEELLAAKAAGIGDISKVAACPLPFAAGPALRFGAQAAFEPVRYLEGLARAFVAAGGEIRTGVRGVTIAGKPGAPQLHTACGLVLTASSLLVATNSPFNTLVSIHVKQAAYTTYMIAVRIPAGSVPDALFWDEDDPYHYLRILSDKNEAGDLLLVGGEDVRTGNDKGYEPYVELERWTKQRFPMAGELAYTWSGQVMEPADGLAYIGRSPGSNPDIFLITGDSGNGLTHGTLGAMIVKDLILNRENPWTGLYDPSRLPRGSLGKFVGENLKTFKGYAQLATAGDIKGTANIRPGEGAVIRCGLRKTACYRDEGGKLHFRSAMCTHLDGVVSWNEVEKSWDCPCHGSRFDALGRMIHGPATEDLAAADPVD